jgi:DNA-binding transcriptional LysR family regulator
MIAARLGEDARPTVVGSPDYLARQPRPRVPADLQNHNCIRLRFASGAIHQWAFEKRRKRVEVEVNGSLITSDGDLAVRAALDGVGLARLPASSVDGLVAGRKLIPLLEDWAPPSVGFYLCYPSRRQVPAPLQAFIDFVKAHTPHGTQ